MVGHLVPIGIIDLITDYNFRQKLGVKKLRKSEGLGKP